MVPDDYNKGLLLLLAFREARGEGPEGMRAVMHVVRNRVQKGWGDWNGVMTRVNQFSSLTVLGDSQTTVWPSDNDVANLTTIVDAIYRGSDSDSTNGGLYYANESQVSSGWYVNNVINSGAHPVTAIIGKHTFRA